MSASDPIGALLAALADATRRDILDALAARGASSATALAGRLTISRQAVVKHLRVLETVGAVRSERVGREVRYRLDPAPMRRASAWFERAARKWDDALSAIKRAAEQ